MGRRRASEHLKPGEERELKGLAKDNPWQYKNNLVRMQRRDKVEYEIEIVRRDNKVYFKRNG
jgi:hypothetical protein